MVAHWDTDPDAWDGCVLGGFRLPGRAKVTCKAARKIDKKPAVGKNGASLTDQGGHPGEVKISLSMVDQADWDAWCLLAPLLNPTRTKPQAFTIVHPQTQALGIDKIVVEDIDAGDPENGIFTVQLGCVEWFPAAKKGAAKKGKGVTNLGSAPGAANILDMARDSKVAAAAAAHDAKTGGLAGPPPPSQTENRP
jgi:hypothetical protein